MPPGIENAYYFQIFNTISWQIVQGQPIFLFFSFLGATNTVLGLAYSLNPLMNMLQIPAASHVERIGYRAFVLRGWASRTFFIGTIALVPLLLYILDQTTCMMLTLFLLFMYSTLRGISSCGFLPWITQLVPEKVRGTYISRDQMYGSFAGLITMAGVAGLFYPKPTRISFAITFLASLLSALISLYFLTKMPDVPVPASSKSSEKVPWREILFYRPFFKIMRYNLILNSGFAASGIFWMSVLRVTYHWNSSQILCFGAASTLITIGTLWFFGKMIDRVGSLPLLNFATLILVVHFSIWFMAASQWIPFHKITIALILISGGMGGPIFNLANTRLVMATVPEMGRSHFFALYSVLNSLTLGIMAIFWGIVLDALHSFHWYLGTFDVDNYALLYFVLVLTMLVSLPFFATIKEKRAMSNEEFFRELLVDSPGRAITRLIRSRPFMNP